MVRVITRQSFFGKYRGYILGATPIAVLLLGITVTYSLINQQNDVRSRASLLESDSNKVYNDALLEGWEDKSWNSTNTFNLLSPVFSGSFSISFVNNKPYAGFYLKREAPLALPFWAKLVFNLQAGNTGEQYSVSILNDKGTQIGQKILLSNLGGNPEVGAWKTYSIPLSGFGVIDKSIGGILIRDESGVAGNTLFIDELKFEVSQKDEPETP